MVALNGAAHTLDEAASIRVRHVTKEFDSPDGGITPGALALDDRVAAANQLCCG